MITRLKKPDSRLLPVLMTLFGVNVPTVVCGDTNVLACSAPIRISKSISQWIRSLLILGIRKITFIRVCWSIVMYVVSVMPMVLMVKQMAWLIRMTMWRFPIVPIILMDWLLILVLRIRTSHSVLNLVQAGVLMLLYRQTYVRKNTMIWNIKMYLPCGKICMCMKMYWMPVVM